MKVFVTGVKGQLGFDVMKELNNRGINCIGSDIDESRICNESYITLDITEKQSVFETIKNINPDVVIHCAAWTAVDAAEDDENQEKAFKINEGGTKNIAEACKAINCKMVYISTDYVFNGEGARTWEADCKEFAPLNVYGKSKLQGELAVSNVLDKYFIVRIAWVFGVNGNNFVKTMLRVGQKYNKVRVINDQIGTPTYTVDLARLLVDMIQTDKYGFYHATNEGGYISWYDFCCEIYNQYGLKTTVVPVSTKEYGLNKAERPYNSRLDKSKLIENGFEPLPNWKDAIRRYLIELKNQESVTNGTN